MSKGIIFTMDATVALGVFIASLFVFYSYFVTVEPFGLRGAGIYMKADNYLSAQEVNEAFSCVLRTNQTGNTTLANQLFESIRNASEYPANMWFYLYNEATGSVDLKWSSAPNIFSDKIVLRRYAILSITSNVSPYNPIGVLNLTANTTSVNRVMDVPLSVTNPGTSTIYVDTKLAIYFNDTNTASCAGSGTNTLVPGWVNSPDTWTFNLAPGETQTHHFYVTVPDAAIGAYLVYANVTSSSYGPFYDAYSTYPFNVVRFGMVEVEVGV